MSELKCLAGLGALSYIIFPLGKSETREKKVLLLTKFYSPRRMSSALFSCHKSKCILRKAWNDFLFPA